MAKKPCCTFYFRFRCLLASLLKIRCIDSFFNILVKFRFRPNHIFILAIRIIFYYSQIKILIKSTPVISKCTRLKAWFWIVGFFFYLFHSLSGINKFSYTWEKINYLLIFCWFNSFSITYHNIYSCHSPWYICFCTCHSGFCSKSYNSQVYSFFSIYSDSQSCFWNQPCIFGDQIVGSCWYLQNDGVVSLQDIFVINEVVNLFTRYWCKMCYRQ